MKRILALLLAMLMLTGCVPKELATTPSVSTTAPISSATPEFDGLDDPTLLTYVEDTVYTELVTVLNNEGYFVENVQAKYISKEYLEDVAYNSQSNIFFGYNIADLNAIFQGERYVFTLGEDGQTTVKAFEAYDDTYEQALKNVAIGTGVILLCVTVSVVTGGAGAPAVSMIFAASAKTGALMGLASGAFGGIAAGVVTGVQTKDFDEAVKAAAFAGSEGFKWGAISGAIEGGVAMGSALKGATLNGLTMNEAAVIQKESKLPLEFIKNFHSVDEYHALKNAGLNLSKVNGKMALTQPIDWNYVDDAGRTNAQRVSQGLAPQDPTGKSYELHHIGQQSDSPLAILTFDDHKTNYSIYHKNTGSSAGSVDHGSEWAKQKREFWNALLKMSQGGN